MTAKEQLRSIIDGLSEDEAATALMLIERVRDEPMLRALANADPDDEATAVDEDAAAMDALASYERGDALSPDEIKRDLGIAAA